jgi:glyoxylase-like metal-dependent hydrolase (beta-lactamase superfamily II)
MKRVFIAMFVLSATGALIGQGGQSASTTLDAAAAALGAPNLTSVYYSGRGSTFNFGQAVNATAPWPRQVLKTFEADIHLTTPAMRMQAYRTNPDGTAPFGGFLQQQYVSENLAWNLATFEDGPQPPGAAPAGGGPGGPARAGGPPAGGPPPAGAAPAGGPPAGAPPAGAPPAGGPPAAGGQGGAGAPGGAARGGGGGRGGPAGIPQPAATAADRRTQIWMTPPGFIQAARANNATVTTKGGNKVVEFALPDGQKFSGVINGQNLITSVTTWVDNPVLGDTAIETTFTDYKNFGTIKFPSHIVQKQGGAPVLDLMVMEARANQAVPVNVPMNIRNAQPTPPPPPAESRKLADGVWLIPASHNSLVVEFADYVVVIEAPLTEARSDYVIAETHRLVPNKPIRYVVNTHQHFDHSGGLRTFAAEGATIVTSAMYKPYYDRVFALPHTLNPDKLAKSGKKAVVEGFTGKRVLMDSTQSIELYTLQGNPHNEGMVVAYLPKEKILVNADLFTPPAANAPAPAAAPATPDPNAVNLYTNVERLKLDVSQIVPIHGNPGPWDTLPKAIGKS